MGCDIHAYVEFKSFDRWQAWTDKSVWLDRDYWMFGTLAQVRNDAMPHSYEPKGLPPDVSRVVKEESEIWDEDGHSHSWLSTNEYLLAMTHFIMNQMSVAARPIHQPSTKYRALASALAAFGDDGRVVFWFDN